MGDFDGDLRQDVAFIGGSSRGVRLLGVLSDHGRGRVVELAQADSLAHPAAFSLRYVPRGTQIPECDGKRLEFGTDGIELKIPGDGRPYFYHYAEGTFHEFAPGN